MIKLNDNNIFVGYIKKILNEFNLPNCFVGSEQAVEGTFYIQNNNIYKKINGKDIPLDNYVYNRFYDGLTTNLSIDNSLYDRKTHRYLGKYLQFLKAYNNIDLMSLYNCFDQEVLNDDIYKTELNVYPHTKYFGKTDDNYITYKLPINKLNSGLFSIYLQTNSPIETIIAIDNYYNENEKIVEFKLISESYHKLNIFKSKLLDVRNCLKTNLDLIKARSKNFNISLLIKLPINLKCSVVILDGDFINNKLLFDMDSYNDYRIGGGRYMTDYNVNPQLTNYTNTNSYLLADKIIMYMSQNVITPISQYYDIQKIQNYLLTNKQEYDRYIDSETGDLVILTASLVDSKNKKLQSLYNDTPGYWSDTDTQAIEQTMLNYIFDKDDEENVSLNFCSDYFDRLPYVDKDIEILMHNNITAYEEEALTKGV